MDSDWVGVAAAVAVLFVLTIATAGALMHRKKKYPKVDRSKTTLAFDAWRAERIGKRDRRLRAGISARIDSEDNLKMTYAHETKKSPFLGDESFNEAGKFLEENGILHL